MSYSLLGVAAPVPSTAQVLAMSVAVEAAGKYF
jgi:hypothetical protein